MIYTTKQLISALDTEFSAHVKGDRMFASARSDCENTSASLDSYWSIRDQIHAYQTQHKVSGLVTTTKEMPNGARIQFPIQHYQLILIDGDIDILRAAKDRVVDMFVEYVRTSCCYLMYRLEARNRAEWDMETTLDFVSSFAADMDWAALSNLDEPGECSLSLGYGSPVDGDYIESINAENWIFFAQTFCKA